MGFPSIADFAQDPGLFADPPPMQDTAPPSPDEPPVPKRSPFKLKKRPRVTSESPESTVDPRGSPRIKLESPEPTIDTNISPLGVRRPRSEFKTPERTVDPNVEETQAGPVCVRVRFILKFGNDSIDGLSNLLKLYDNWDWAPDTERMERLRAMNDIFCEWKSRFLDLKAVRRHLEPEQCRYREIKRLVAMFEEMGWDIMKAQITNLGYSHHVLSKLMFAKFAWSHRRAAELLWRGY